MFLVLKINQTENGADSGSRAEWGKTPNCFTDLASVAPKWLGPHLWLFWVELNLVQHSIPHFLKASLAS